MSDKTVTQADLCEAARQAARLSRKESADLVELIIEDICGSIDRGEWEKLSAFGEFVVRSKNKRVENSWGGAHVR